MIRIFTFSYQRLNHVCGLVNSLKTQTRRNFVHHLHLLGYSAEQLEFVRRVVNGDDRFVMSRLENLDQRGNLLRILAEMPLDADCYAKMDDDDVYLPTYLEEIHKAALTGENDLTAFTTLLRHNQRTGTSYLVAESGIYGMTMCLSRRAVAYLLTKPNWEHGGYEDSWLDKSLEQAGFKRHITRTEIPLVLYVQHATNISCADREAAPDGVAVGEEMKPVMAVVLPTMSRVIPAGPPDCVIPMRDHEWEGSIGLYETGVFMLGATGEAGNWDVADDENLILEFWGSGRKARYISTEGKAVEATRDEDSNGNLPLPEICSAVPRIEFDFRHGGGCRVSRHPGGRETESLTGLLPSDPPVRRIFSSSWRRWLPQSPAAMLTAGIVGLPNVGKSTLFNAVTRTRKAEAANYPFCTIDPNIGIVTVPDPRLAVISRISGSHRLVPTAIEFVDIAGLVKGASEGAGLGNKFLATIRETDAIVQVVRCFENEDIIHELGTVDPVRDIEIINAELILADMATLEKRRVSRDKKAKGGDKDAKREVELIDIILPHLDEGKPALTLSFSDEDRALVRDFFLLSAKRTVYACNVAEDELAATLAAPDSHPQVAKVRHYAAEHSGSEAVVISARIEEELSDMAPEEAAEFLTDMGVTDSGVSGLIGAVYHLLGLRTYLTTGVQESRAWTIHAGDKAPAAAGVIHTDFERGFIAAEVVAYDDLVAAGSKAAAKVAGKVRIEGKEYVVKDGDVIDFRFNV